jgi:hypothetical protein
MHKYFEGDRLHCLDHPPLAQNGSQIWSLLKTSLPLIKNNLSWSLGNGKCINLTTDKIHGSPSLEQESSLLPLLPWLSKQGKNSIYDIFSWNMKKVNWLVWILEPLLLTSNLSCIFSLQNLKVVLPYPYPLRTFVVGKINITLLSKISMLYLEIYISLSWLLIGIIYGTMMVYRK